MSGWTAPGIGHVPEYLVSGAPWATGSLAVGTSAQKIEFGNVTRFFIVRNSGANPCRVGFTEAGVSSSNFYSVAASGGVQQFDLRVRDIFLQGDGGATTVDVLGGLTAISRNSYLELTGANPPPEGHWYLPGVE